MKLLFINQTLGNPGGAEVFNSDLLNQLAKTKKIHLSVISNNTLFLEMIDSHRISKKHIPYVVDIVGNWKGLLKAPFFVPFLFYKYWQSIQKNKPDLIFMSGFIEKIIASPIAFALGIPVIWIEFGPLSPLFKKFFGLPRFLYYLVKKIPKTIIVPSYNTLKHLKTELGVTDAKFTYIQCGRKLNHNSQNNKKEQQIVCISRLEKGKGQDLLLQAFQKVQKTYPSCKLVLVGTGDFEPHLRKLTKKLKIENQVTFLGRVSDALKILSESEIAVFPSVWQLEGFGIVLTEALYVGTPVVAFDHGPGNEIVKNNVNGLLAKSGSIKDLATKISVLLSSKKLQKKLINQGKKDFAQRYDIKNVAQKYLELFQIWG